MAIVTINDDYLDNIADAIREKGGTVPALGDAIETKISKTSNADGFESSTGSYGSNRDIYDVVTISGATTIKVKMGYQTEAVSFDYVQVAAGSLSAMPEGTKKYGGPDGGIVELTFENTDTVTFYFHSDDSYTEGLGYYAEVSGYTSEERSTTYRPKDMATAIQSITAGGEESSNNTYRDYYVSAENNSTGVASTHYMDFDVTNANTFTFTYDYLTSTTSNYRSEVDINAYLGYKVGPNTNTTAMAPRHLAVDSVKTSQTICSDLKTNTTGVVVTLDVSQYTYITLRVNSYAKTNGTSCYGCLFIHDITLS